MLNFVPKPANPEVAESIKQALSENGILELQERLRGQLLESGETAERAKAGSELVGEAWRKLRSAVESSPEASARLQNWMERLTIKPYTELNEPFRVSEPEPFQIKSDVDKLLDIIRNDYVGKRFETGEFKKNRHENYSELSEEEKAGIEGVVAELTKLLKAN